MFLPRFVGIPQIVRVIFSPGWWVLLISLDELIGERARVEAAA
jgi:hypothetical protein